MVAPDKSQRNYAFLCHFSLNAFELFRRCGGARNPKAIPAARQRSINERSLVGLYKVFIAAESTSRLCVGIELDPIYVDVVIRRWEAFTGRKSMLDGEGASFEEVATQRGEQPKPPNVMSSEGEAACDGDDQSRRA